MLEKIQIFETVWKIRNTGAYANFFNTYMKEVYLVWGMSQYAQLWDIVNKFNESNVI
jgi:hypothetical protein